MQLAFRLAYHYLETNARKEQTMTTRSRARQGPMSGYQAPPCQTHAFDLFDNQLVHVLGAQVKDLLDFARIVVAKGWLEKHEGDHLVKDAQDRIVGILRPNMAYVQVYDLSSGSGVLIWMVPYEMQEEMAA